MALATILWVGQALFAQPPTVFPGSFTGSWKGKLQWMVTGKPSREFTMQLIITPAENTGQYNWLVIYGDSSGTVDNRPYLLKPVDTVIGHWLIDERNGIFLDSYVFGNCLQGAFTVQGNTIVNNYCVAGNKLSVEFFSINLQDKKTSGKGTSDVPLVNSYKMGSYQTGVLLRQE